MLLYSNHPPFPDDPDALIEPEFDFNKTTRERFHEKTNQSRCASCHSMINPPAFAFEQFDALGRYRQSEELIDNGSVVNSLPIDSSVDLQLFDGTQVQAQGASDLIAKVSQESAAPACFVQKWVDYAYARKNNEKDSCGMAEMYDLVNSEDSGVVGMVKAIVGMDSFRVRKVSGEE